MLHAFPDDGKINSSRTSPDRRTAYGASSDRRGTKPFFSGARYTEKSKRRCPHKTEVYYVFRKDKKKEFYTKYGGGDGAAAMIASGIFFTGASDVAIQNDVLSRRTLNAAVEARA